MTLKDLVKTLDPGVYVQLKENSEILTTCYTANLSADTILKNMSKGDKKVSDYKVKAIRMRNYKTMQYLLIEVIPNE